VQDVTMSDRPAAVIAHGSGSTADFARRAFGPALRASGYELVTWDERTGDVHVATDRLAELATRAGARIVGGISMGAHAAAWVAAGRRDLDGVLLALPAWTGPPGATAELSGAAAGALARDGLARTLDRFVRSGWVDWVRRELAEAWAAWSAGSAYDEEALVAALLRTASSPAPTLDELAKIAAPVGIAAFVDDAFHPLDVAREWQRAIPRAALRTLRLADAEADRGAVGQAAVDAWRMTSA
jgi:pimeloyl-ACP methyl ester carboxylesterase